MAGSIVAIVANHVVLIPPNSAKKAFLAWKSRQSVSPVHPIVAGKAHEKPMMNPAPSVVVRTVVVEVD